MNLVQFNVNIPPKIKKQVRLDSFEFDVNQSVIANAAFEEFFKQEAEARKQCYAKEAAGGQMLPALNVDVPSETKKRVRLDAFENAVNHSVIATAIFKLFFKLYRTKQQRREVYQKVKESMDALPQAA